MKTFAPIDLFASAPGAVQDVRPRAQGSPEPTFVAIVCADWSKESPGRSAYVAFPATRVIQRLECPSWTFEQLVERSSSLTKAGAVLLGIDLPIGIPKSLAGSGPSGFPDWLRAAKANPELFRPCENPDEWSPTRPFFRVSAGVNGYKRWTRKMEKVGIVPFRQIDTATGAKPMFVVSGIPGSVGSAAVDVWSQLDRHRHRYSIWPFDGSLNELAKPGDLVLAEIYPRALYGIATSSKPVEGRSRRRIDKGSPECRRAALDVLVTQWWVRQFEVHIRNQCEALTSGDDFDALMSAAALLRCTLERTSLESAYSDKHEGGILASESLNLDLPEVTFPCGTVRAASRTPERNGASGRSTPAQTVGRRCPIPACQHIFKAGRLGWDAHVASLKVHPDWHPEVIDQAERKRLFRSEFPQFFGA